jgi:hypothetical protein
LAVLVAVSALRAEPPEGEPDAREAVGVFPIETETLLVVRDIPGTVLISTRKAREVRFVSRATDKSGSDRPLGVWFEGTTVTLAPVPGAKAPEGVLRVEVPDGFAVRAEPTGGTMSLDDLSGRVEVRAKDTEIRCREISGDLEVTVERGILRINDAGNATIRAKDAVVEPSTVRGTLTARLEGATKFTATQLGGDLDVESDDAAIVAKDVEGAVRLRARRGTAELQDVRGGGDLHLSACPLKLSLSKGDFSVSSDAPITFEKMTAALHFDLYGGSLHGTQNEGLVEVRTRNTEIGLEAIDGPLRIQGDGLKANVNGVTGDVYVEAALSEVLVAKAGAAVGLKIEQGPVTVQGAAGLLSATVTRGDAKFLSLTGPVALEMDGGNAEVGWTSITGDTDTLIQNAGGDVTVRFPPSATCRVDATSKFGRVESDFPAVRVMDDGKSAQGPIGRGQRPVIKIRAEGNVNLTGAAGGAEPEPEAPPQE